MKRIKWKRCAALCALLGLCMALAACGASQSTAAGTGTAAAQEDSAQASTLEAGGTTALQLPQDGRKLIMNAELTVEALDFDATLTALREAAEQAGGYVSSTYLEGEADSGSRYAHYEFRIPAEQYSTFLAAADGAGNVTQKSESVQDVTAQYVDVEARLASLEAQRESLNAMLAQAQDVETLLAVQRELADVQYEIESYTAQKRTYDDQIAYSTVQVTVHEVRRVTENPQSFASRLGAAFRSGWYGLGQGVQAMNDLFYFSYVTILTVGYGDITPHTWIAKNATVLVAFTAYIYSLVVIATIVGEATRSKKKNGNGNGETGNS